MNNRKGAFDTFAQGTHSVDLGKLGPAPDPCTLDHDKQYAKKVYDQYKSLVGELVKKRRALGLSQEDINAAAGLADGHINKLESFARTAQFPTLRLWAETVGLEITLAASRLPQATARAIDRRVSNPYAKNMARHKADMPTTL
ncbi:helix-turn-helix domain-containing protein [Sulfitobacter sp. MF3-043]|uniref:helix-turn-helix domain-containing protein n=1 Tax=Sulfitobacter sediminivivens TaxID=3252902 RepID=UPI0036D97628